MTFVLSLEAGQDPLLLPKQTLIVVVNLTLQSAHILRELADHNFKRVFVRNVRNHRTRLLILVEVRELLRMTMVRLDRVVVILNLMMLRGHVSMVAIRTDAGSHVVMVTACFLLLLILK